MTAPEKRIKVSIWIPPSLHKAMLHEGVDRGLSLGELVEEALQQRMVAIWKLPKKGT